MRGGQTIRGTPVGTLPYFLSALSPGAGATRQRIVLASPFTAGNELLLFLPGPGRQGSGTDSSQNPSLTHAPSFGVAALLGAAAALRKVVGCVVLVFLVI